MNVLAFSLLLSMPTHDVNDLKKVVDIFWVFLFDEESQSGVSSPFF